MAKYKVLSDYIDKYTKKKIVTGSTIEVDEKRAKEINTGKIRISKVEEVNIEVEKEKEEPKPKNKKKVAKNED